MTFDTGRAYEKHPQVAIRRESFGGLAYHYGNRRLTFLKAQPLVELVEALDGYASADEAIDVHAPAGRRASFAQALAGLLDSEVIRARS